MKKKVVISKEELRTLSSWLDEADAPKDVHQTITKLIKTYSFVEVLIAKNKNILNRFLELMGIKPKSERASQLNQFRGFL